MPYEEYLASASTSAYASTTFSQSSVNSLSTTFYVERLPRLSLVFTSHNRILETQEVLLILILMNSVRPVVLLAIKAKEYHLLKSHMDHKATAYRRASRAWLSISMGITSVHRVER